MRKFIVGVLLTLTAVTLIACSDSKKSEKKPENLLETKEELVDENTEDEKVESNEGDDIYSRDEEELEWDEDFFEDDEENYVEVESLKGKKLSELYDLGFDYSGYGGNGEDYEVYLQKKEEDEDIKKIINDIEGMTVREFVDCGLYGGIYYMSIDDEYTFTSNKGGIYFSFELDDSTEIMELYKDEFFMDVEDMEEFQEKELKNVKFDYMEYMAVLEESATAIFQGDDFEENMINDYKVERCYYESFS